MSKMLRVIPYSLKTGSFNRNLLTTNQLNGHLPNMLYQTSNLQLKLHTKSQVIDFQCQKEYIGKEYYFSCMDMGTTLIFMHTWPISLQIRDMSSQESIKLGLGIVEDRQL
jgi:hypothetical protein